MVGRSHECDFPADVRSLPRATVPRFDVSASSRAIDRHVGELAREARALEALGVYAILPDVLRKVRPTHIVTQSQCDVCAVSERDVGAAVARISQCDTEIVSLRPLRLADVWEDMRRVASALGVPREGAELVASLKARMAAVAEAAEEASGKPTVAFVEWVDPLMAGGNWMPELIDMAGGRCLFGAAGKHSRGCDSRTS